MKTVGVDRCAALALSVMVIAIIPIVASASAVARTPVRISATLAWAGFADRVGTGANARPDGANDGHFVLTVRPATAVRVTEITLRTADSAGKPCCGQLWNTTPDGNWILGVDRGTARLNPSDRAISTLVTTRTVFHLYGSNSGYFTTGQRFLVTVTLATGATFSVGTVIR